MSLLMQALKKAERAKQHHTPDEEPGKPSEAFDDLLSLAPHESAPPATAGPLSLSPLDAPAAADARIEPALDFGHQIPHPAPEPEPAAPPRRARNAPPPPPPPKPKARRRAVARPDARTIRIAALSGIVLLIGAVFGYIYWHALYGPGSSTSLPMVPMPGQDLPPAAGAPANQPIAELPGFAPAPPQPASAPVPAPPAASQPGSSRGPGGPDDYMRMEQAQQAPAAAPAAPPAARQDTPAPASDNGNIRVARISTPAQVNPAVQSGYTAFNRGDSVSARQFYQSVLRQDANSRDALLGMAAIAVRDKQGEQAAAIYARLLEIDPNDADALAGLSGLRQGEPGQAENRLKRMLERSPESGSALYALGNLYARQGRWQEAQQLYFRAYSSAPGNADYAYNLAVGLDRLNQSKLALTYYQRALELATGGPVGFDRAAASARVRELGGQ